MGWPREANFQEGWPFDELLAVVRLADSTVCQVEPLSPVQGSEGAVAPTMATAE